MIQKAAYENIDSWMCLVRKVASSFPGMDFEEHEKTLRAFIDRGEALVCLKDGRVVGALLFSKEESVLAFLAVDPDERRKHIARNLVSMMLSQIGRAHV